MAKSRKKKLLLALLIVLVIYGLWLGQYLLRFRPLVLESANTDPLELVGIYHIHTTLSDGRKPPEKIAEIAARQSLDFLILTDHGSPNHPSLESQGWYQDVLVLAGSELSVNRGHLVGLGFDTLSQAFSDKAEQAAYQINQNQGISIIAHPYSKVQWTWGDYQGYSGIEIISADAMLRKNFYRWLPFAPLLPFYPKVPLIKILGYPEKNLRKWDEMNRTSPVYGYYSCDAHFLYGPLFSILQLHLLLDNSLPQDFSQARQKVLDVLRQGRFYNAIDAAAPASGFQFWGEGGSTIWQMGSSTVYSEPVYLNIKIPSPFKFEAYLVRNGQSVFTSRQQESSFLADKPGTYRVEVYLREKSPLHNRCPWILSNPIFLREKTS